MDKRVIVPISNRPGALVFYCPGCKANHLINTDPDVKKPHHVFTGTLEKPTIRESILRYADSRSPRCHSYITGGMIEYLSDTTHELAGQTVKLEPVD